MPQFAADPTGYHLWGTNELAANGLEKLCRLGYYAPFVPDTLSCSGTLRGENDPGNRARRLSAALSHFELCRAVTIPGTAAITRMKEKYRALPRGGSAFCDLA